MASEEPHPLVVLLRLVDAFETTLRASLPREVTTAERAQIVQITNKIGPGSYIASMVQGQVETEQMGVAMGDQYTVGQAGAVGPGAEAHDMTFNQVWNQMANDMDLPALRTELTTLRQALKEQATEPDHDLTIAEVASAEIAASKGDGPTVLVHLRNAGKWALDAATAIGTAVAAAAIRAAMGLG
jgi:hypothetical protein